MFITADVLPVVTGYLGADTSWTPAEIEQTVEAEIAAQAAVVRFPDITTGDNGPPALLEALCRRVARNLAMRSSPLGVQSSMTEFGTSAIRLGSTDPEVRRLEAPYRRLVVG